MHLRHFEVVDALLRTGSFTAAGEWLGLAPAAVESLLDECEHDNRLLLFSRVRGRLQATAEALQLQSAGQRLLEELEQLRRVTGELRDHRAPPLRLMACEALIGHVLPLSVAALRRRFPDTPCQLACADLSHMQLALLMRQCDLALSLEPATHPDLQSTVLHSGKVHLIAPRGWLGGRQRHANLTLLAGEGMVALEQPNQLGQALEQRLRKLAPPPRLHLRVQSLALLRAMIEAGEGLALVDPFTAHSARLAGLDQCPVSPAIEVKLYALQRTGAETGAALRALSEIVSEKAIEALAG
ncbi:MULTISPECIES: LysR family transcriptional regulator [unclassified Pseudomonas]|uniref:LysR family transcriptional regulator n=1 Tax=unclassified Pseudomonas TaxID=196821 RepID=UPI000BD038B6|nr:MULTISPECIES: LysR substrate-binding domain-containing protein [unclassified Pseudomonas]PVZ13579.1 DNA-binding transcriptional LysR family regulator [Pseudomonas sp. URIL14HWK12:I12]PVZ23885.1 DNA-binding transcriptional LysR family regulator [Pseudomonas sp. URIL14HWK12:I10]PVZ33476.1 DNA-binding transcriptional LysR family regulator [Pseudomonas sp. URIL14HWK12:I11]SNZ11707.1 DNA-binding transcriptional regulator, LysR family [Pseudomonas sp. URIL14HWK12:I9]